MEGKIMKSLGVIHIALVILTLFAVGCGEDEVPTYINEEEEPSSQPENEAHDTEVIESMPEPPETTLQLSIRSVMDELERGIEEEDLELYLGAFWADDYYYHSDMSTDDPADDVMFEHIQQERDSAEQMFGTFHGFEVEFIEEQLEEIDGAEVEVRNRYELVASIAPGKGLPDGYQKVFSKGSNLLTFKNRDGEWRISRWEQEEMSQDEVRKEIAKGTAKLFPPEGALLMHWGMLKAMF
jgi:hypothetical protein